MASEEAKIEQTEEGAVTASPGWFVAQPRRGPLDAQRGRRRVGGLRRRRTASSSTRSALHVLQPGQPNGKYHSETVQEDFLVLSGECILIVEDEERHLKAWDFFHCAPGTNHIIVGAGDGPCAILMVGVRSEDKKLHYPVSEVAARHGASSPVGHRHAERGVSATGRGSTSPCAATWPL